MEIAIITILLICIGKIKWANIYEKGLLKIAMILSTIHCVTGVAEAFITYGVKAETVDFIEMAKKALIASLPMIATALVNLYCQKKFEKVEITENKEKDTLQNQ